MPVSTFITVVITIFCNTYTKSKSRYDAPRFENNYSSTGSLVRSDIDHAGVNEHLNLNKNKAKYAVTMDGPTNQQTDTTGNRGALAHPRKKHSKNELSNCFVSPPQHIFLHIHIYLFPLLFCSYSSSLSLHSYVVHLLFEITAFLRETFQRPLVGLAKGSGKHSR